MEFKVLKSCILNHDGEEKEYKKGDTFTLEENDPLITHYKRYSYHFAVVSDKQQKKNKSKNENTNVNNEEQVEKNEAGE